MLLDLVGERRRAIEHHAKRIVELAEVGIVDQLAGVFRRDEAADRDAEAHDQECEERPRQHLDPARTHSASPGWREARASRSKPCGGQVRRSRWPGTGRDASGVCSTMRAMCSTAARKASVLGARRRRHHQRQHDAARGRDFLVAARQAAEVGVRAGRRRRRPRSRRASSRRRPRRCRRPRTSRSRCSPTAHSGRRARRGPGRGCRRPAPCRCGA